MSRFSQSNVKNSAGVSCKISRAHTKIQKTRNYHFFTAFDKAKAKFGEANVKINTKMPVRSVEVKGELAFEQGEFALIGRFMGVCVEMKSDHPK